MSKKKNENLGKPAEDKITGFKGIITGFAQYLTGCDQYLVTPACAENHKYPDGSWFDVNRLEIQDKVAVSLEAAAADPGCDSVAPTY
jgi:hypothetical protein